MARKNWWPTAIADQLVLVNNFATKIASYNLALPLTAPQVALAQGLCEAFVGAVNMTELARTTMQAMTQWRDLVLEGEPVGDPVPASPTFPAGGAVDYTRGTVPQFFKFRELILAAPGYTETIGQDLGLIGAEITPEPEGDVTPDRQQRRRVLRQHQRRDEDQPPHQAGGEGVQDSGEHRVRSGAGDGNRTHASSLGSCSSTIELHPRSAGSLCRGPAAGNAVGRAAIR